MRLKQLLGLVTLLLVLSSVGLAATSQLTSVNAAAQGNATVVTLHASGAFTHTEYRPTDTLLLVDLTGVSAGKWKELTRDVNLPGVNSYHVVGYTGSNGSEVARMELNLAPGSVVDIAQAGDALSVKISNKHAVATNAPAPAAAAVEKPAMLSATRPAAMKTDTPAHSSAMVTVNNISVVRGEGTLDIEINGTGPMTAKMMKLS
jgi:hypothetical protein